MSSGVPRCFVSEDSVENGEEFSCHSGDGEHLGFSGFEKAFVECLEGWLVSASHNCCDEDCRAHSFSSTSNHALGFPMARLARVSSKASQARNALAVKRAQFRHLSEKGAGGLQPHPRNGSEQVHLLPPGWRSTNRVVVFLIEFSQFF